MFSKYTYKPSSTLSNVYADIVAIITGETNIANLSSDCDQLNSNILSTTASGWSTNGTNQNISLANPLTQVLTNRTGTFGSGTISSNDVFYSPTMTKYYDFGAWSTLSPAGLLQLSYSTDGSTTITPVTYSANSPTTSSIVNKVSCMGDNGAYVVWLIGGGTTNYAYYSVNGTSFASTTAIDADWKAITNIGTTFVAVASGVSGVLGGVVAGKSIDNGVTWTSETIPIGNYQAACSNGTIAVAVGNNVCATYDGTTWTARTIPQNGTYFSVAWNGSVFCAIGINCCATSADGITWVSRNLINTNGHELLVDSNSNNFVMFTNTTTVAYSPNGSFWYYKTITAISIVSTYLFRSSTCVNGILIAHNQITSAGSIYKYDLKAVLCRFFKASNTVYSGDSTFKHVSIDASNSFLYLYAYESVNSYIYKNPSYITTPNVYAQQFDLINGGIVYIMATPKYLILYSYLSLSANWGCSTGSPNGSPIGVFEYSRDDLWNVASGEYPCWGLMWNGVTDCYVPRLKNTTSLDLTGVTSVLIEAPDYAITKQILDANNIPYNSVREIRLYNPNQTNLIIGGKMLGNVKRTTDTIAANFDEFTVDGNTYLLVKFGTKRLLIPKV